MQGDGEKTALEVWPRVIAPWRSMILLKSPTSAQSSDAKESCRAPGSSTGRTWRECPGGRVDCNHPLSASAGFSDYSQVDNWGL